MSWAAHEFESFVLQRHLKTRVSYLGVLVGCLLPDLFTKLPVYGLHVGDLELIKAEFPAQYHRGWPGVGPTHSLAFGVLAAVVVLAVVKSRVWALGLLVGQWSHVLTDAFDSVGTMVFFPFTTQRYSFGAWEYSAQRGRYGDAAAYYSSLGLIWDLFWLGMVLLGFEVLTRRFFTEHVEPVDPAWGWLRRRLGCSDVVLLAIYRAWFVYGAARVTSWFLWARFLNPNRGAETFDLSWGGPAWVDDVVMPVPDWGDALIATTIGSLGTAMAVWVVWRVLGRRLWERAEPDEPPVAVSPVDRVGVGARADEP